MPSFSSSSLKKLQGVHQDLQVVCHYAIKEYDFTVLFGYRDPEKQFSLWKIGREEIGGIWTIVDKSKVVTYKDGYRTLSKHQLRLAVDLVPYYSKYPHIRWKDTKGLYHFGGYIRGIADMLKKYDAINNDIIWGNDWDDDFILDDQTFYDAVHFQIK